MGRKKKILLEEFDKYSDSIFDNVDKFFEKLDTFSDYKEIILEIGCGNGKFFADLVKNNPDSLCIGCDLRKDRLIKTYKKIEQSNFILYAGDVINILDEIKEGFIDKLYINFPDPRPKKREWKHRFFNPGRIEILVKIMKKGSKLYIKTDHEEYFNFTRTMLYVYRKDFRELGCNKDVDTDEHGYLKTEFEEKWLKEGKNVMELRYEKIY